MAKYIVCENCKNVVEYKPEEHYEGGLTYTTFTCPMCKIVKTTNKNHIHYGNDGKK